MLSASGVSLSERSRRNGTTWASASLHHGCTCPGSPQRKSGPSCRSYTSTGSPYPSRSTTRDTVFSWNSSMHIPCKLRQETVLRKLIVDAQSASSRCTIAGQALQRAHGPHRTLRPCGTHPRRFQRIQYPHPPRNRRASCDRLPANGQHIAPQRRNVSCMSAPLER